jgi:hypothetical protein
MMKYLLTSITCWFAEHRYLRWLSHFLVALGATVLAAFIAHYLLILYWLPWWHGALLGASASLVYYSYREGRDIEWHRRQWEWIRGTGDVPGATRYRREWTLDGWMGAAGPALVWALATWLVIAIGG